MRCTSSTPPDTESRGSACDQKFAGYGHRYDARDYVAYFRPVLYHEVHRPRPGPGGGSGNRAWTQGRFENLQLSRSWTHVPAFPFPAVPFRQGRPNSRRRARPLLAAPQCLQGIDIEEMAYRLAWLMRRLPSRKWKRRTDRPGLTYFAGTAIEVTLILPGMVTMPGKSGEETFRELRMLQSDVVVVLSSGYNEAETIRRFTGKGLAGFLQKPYSAARLAQVIRIALGADPVARPSQLANLALTSRREQRLGREASAPVARNYMNCW